jgi:hypothetical protein
MITVDDILKGNAPKSKEDELQKTIDSAKSIIMAKLDYILDDTYIEAKTLKDVTSIVISIENSLKESENEGILEALLSKYSRKDDV